MMRNRAISVDSGSRSMPSGKSSLVLIPLRFANSSVYQRAAEANPTSSSRGGCKRHDRVRVSTTLRSTDSNAEDNASVWFGAAELLSEYKFIFMVAKYC